MGPNTPQAPDAGGARPPARRGAGRADKAPAASEEPAAPGREFVNAPSNRTNIALPFSQIRLQEPSAELYELAGLVCELVEAFENSVPKAQRDGLKELHARAQALRLRLR
jgi:hypothetical protein